MTIRILIKSIVVIGFGLLGFVSAGILCNALGLDFDEFISNEWSRFGVEGIGIVLMTAYGIYFVRKLK